MAMRWKLTGLKTGLSAIGAGPRPYTLSEGGVDFADVYPKRERMDVIGWYWVTNSDAGLPRRNTCEKLCPDADTAKAEAMEFVKACRALASRLEWIPDNLASGAALHPDAPAGVMLRSDSRIICAAVLPLMESRQGVMQVVGWWWQTFGVAGLPVERTIENCVSSMAKAQQQALAFVITNWTDADCQLMVEAIHNPAHAATTTGNANAPAPDGSDAVPPAGSTEDQLLAALHASQKRDIFIAGLQALHRERTKAFNVACDVAAMTGSPAPDRTLFGIAEVADMLRWAGASGVKF